MFMIRIIKTYPSAQTFGFFDVELRVQLLEATGNPLSRLDTVIDWEGFRPLLEQALAKTDQGAGRSSGQRPDHWAAQRSGDWLDQPDLSRRGGSPLRIPIPNRDCHEPLSEP
jgi:hypothetical protein